MTDLTRVPAGVRAGGQFARALHAEPGPDLSLTNSMGSVDTSYRVGHRAPENDDYSNSLDRLADSFAPDVYEHPDRHGSGEHDEQTMAQLVAARGNPEATVTIYRAVPPGVEDINPGDWVTLSRAYAQQHAIQDSDEDNDWPILEQQVKAGHVWTDGNDLSEFGYDPRPCTEPEPDQAGLSELEALATRGKDAHSAEATLAVLRGTARKELAERFAASGLGHADLAARVGHSTRVARRVVAGQEPLNESIVAAYFRAMG
ncbi:hypothetical protein LG293_17670 (plasmid) [Citricoccus nitrophenolicus]